MKIDKQLAGMANDMSKIEAFIIIGAAVMTFLFSAAIIAALIVGVIFVANHV